ncbi:hypothetical protein [Clostridium frigidicarnis]|uniref:Uncharacterized protein n=1 Tax=Clostridium frigidicarnis TaxID=84698 RepID=A0A1I1ADT5_9CLOT|nr:hypothetical protein [Clostridium frigidicarnis]SFB36161.1 hypothetical protein SAMN04488528_103424 [Clostridium frigidicarnis]
MVVVYPKYFIMPIIIDNDLNFTKSNQEFRNNEKILDEQVINGNNDEFFEFDNEFVKSQIE